MSDAKYCVGENLETIKIFHTTCYTDMSCIKIMLYIGPICSRTYLMRSKNLQLTATQQLLRFNSDRLQFCVTESLERQRQSVNDVGATPTGMHHCRANQLAVTVATGKSWTRGAALLTGKGLVPSKASPPSVGRPSVIGCAQTIITYWICCSLALHLLFRFLILPSIPDPIHRSC